MISERNTQNLLWFADQYQPMDGYWFAIWPTLSVWNKVIEPIQEFTAQELKNEGINNWAPYPQRLGHISVFVGLNEKTTGDEKVAISRRIAEKVSQIKSYPICFENARVQRGPGKFVTLHFNSPATKAINALIREAISDAILNNEFDRSHLKSTAKGDNLDRDILPHITLGIIDVEDSEEIPWEEKHKDIQALGNKNNKAQFEKSFKQRFKPTGNFSVSSVELIGSNSLSKTLKVAEKSYLTLASCELNQTSPATKKISSIPKQTWYDPTWNNNVWSEIVLGTIFRNGCGLFTANIAVMVRRLTNNPTLELEFKKEFDEYRHPLISIGFKDNHEAEDFFTQINVSDKISNLFWGICNKNNLFWVRLGTKRMTTLFGNEAPKYHAECLKELSYLQTIVRN